MAISAVVPDQPFHVRSTSMPSRPHPIALRAEQELQKLRICVTASSTSAVTTQMMGASLQGLGDLYACIEELLRLPCSQKALSHPHQRKWVEEELEGSVRLLDLCGASRDNLGSAKDHVQDLQSALRRNDASIESKAKAFVQSRKKSDKDLKNCFNTLKQMDSKCGSYNDKDCDLLLVVKVLMEAREITISLLRSVSLFLSMPRPRQKGSRWSFVSKALRTKKVACEEENEGENGVGGLDVYKCLSCKYVDDGKVQQQLQTLEAGIKVVENGLECLFRRLIQNRVSLLNIISL